MQEDYQPKEEYQPVEEEYKPVQEDNQPNYDAYVPPVEETQQIEEQKAEEL